MATNTRDTEVVGDAVSDGLLRMVDLRADALSDAAEVQTALHTLIGYELERSGAELGDEHPRTLALRSALDATRVDVGNLEIAREVAAADVPDVSEKGVLVSGRVTDKDERGIGDLTVCLVNRSGKAIAGVERAVTRDDGFYAFAIEPRGKEAAAAAKKQPIYVAVFSPHNKLLHQEKTGLILDAGARFEVNVVLDRSEVYDAKEGRTHTIYKAEPADEECDDIEDGVDALVAAIARDDEFGGVGATPGKIIRRLTELGVHGNDRLKEFAAGESRDIRDGLRLRNLESARVFRRILRRVLGNHED